jgi:hypothetical protein
MLSVHLAVIHSYCLGGLENENRFQVPIFLRLEWYSSVDACDILVSQVQVASRGPFDNSTEQHDTDSAWRGIVHMHGVVDTLASTWKESSYISNPCTSSSCHFSDWDRGELDTYWYQ